MEEYLRKLSAYVAEHPPDFHSNGGDAILGALFWAYCENAGADCEVIQQGYDDLNQLLKNMPADHVNTIINTVTTYAGSMTGWALSTDSRPACALNRSFPSNHRLTFSKVHSYVLVYPTF